MGWVVTLIVCLIGFFCLIAGPVAFALVMRLFDRIEQLEKLNGQQSETLKQLSQLCQTFKTKLDEHERFEELGQLSRQTTPDLPAQTSPEEKTVIAESAPTFIAAEIMPETPPPAEPSTASETAATYAIFPETVEASSVQAVELQTPTVVSPQYVGKEEADSVLPNALKFAKEHAEGLYHAEPIAETAPFESPAGQAPVELPIEPVTVPIAEPTVTPATVLQEQPQPTPTKAQPLSPKSHIPNPKASSSATPWLSLELLIGRKVLPWVASILFLLFAVFLFQYAFEKGYIKEVHKTIGMGLLSCVFLGAGKYFAVKRLRYFSTVLTSAGISIAFLTGYATYGFYQLLPARYATGIMTAVVVGSFLLSRYYVSRLLGIVSIIGGLAVPILLRSEIDHYDEFFSYLILLNVGTIVLINVMKRPPIAMLAFIGTQVEFWLWYRGNWQPDKLISVLAFQAAFYLVYLADTSLATLRPKQKASWDDAIRAIISPLLFYATTWYLLQQNEPDFIEQWLGVLTFAFSAWYAIFAVIYARRLSRIWNRKANDELRLYWNGGPAAATTMSLAFLALAIPLQFETNAITVGWVAIGAALWCFGNKLLNRTFVNMSVVFLLLGVGRMVLFDIVQRDETLLTPLANGYAMPIFAAGLILCLAGCLGHSILRSVKQLIFDRHHAWQTTPDDRRRQHSVIERFLNDNMIAEWDMKWQFNYVIGYAGLLIATAILSIETFEYFRLRPDDFLRPVLSGSYALTVLWSLMGLLLLIIALACKAQTIRIASIIVLSITTCKLLFADLIGRTTFGHELEPILNPIAAIIAGVSLLLTALPLISRTCDRRSQRDVRLTFDILGWCGAVSLFVIASFECWYYCLSIESITYRISSNFTFVIVNDNTRAFFATASLSLLWGGIALAAMIIGMLAKNRPARITAIIILALTGCKILAFELLSRPVYVMTFFNPYQLTILAAALVAMFAAVWAVRFRPLASESERMAFTAAGVCGLLLVIVSSSFECWHLMTFGPHIAAAINGADIDFSVMFFEARAALSVFWSIWAIVLFVIGMTCRSQILRVLAMLLLTLVGGFVATMQLFARPDAYETAIANPYFLPIAFAFATMIVLAIWGTRLQRLASDNERLGLTALGLAGLAIAWAAMTVECFSYFHIHTELHKMFIANTSVTVFWTALAVLITLLAHTARSKVLRYTAVALLVVTLGKVLCYELWNRPGDFETLLNPFMLSMSLLAFVLMVLGVFSTRVRPTENEIERQVMFALGLGGLTLIWFALSDECYTYFRDGFESHPIFIANASLTVFWTLLAVVILLISQRFRSLGLRVTAIVLLMITFAKAIPLELIQRPGDLDPVANPYMPVLALLSVVMIGVGVFALGRANGKPSTQISTERLTGQVLAFAGLAMLFVSSSIECHDSVRANIGDEKAVWVAQMAISMLWSIFAGVLVFIGIVWRSAALRWVAIILFAVTTFKVVVYDMAEFDRIYRIGAFFVLALVMMLAAWAYQRFKPELHGDKRSEK